MQHGTPAKRKLYRMVVHDNVNTHITKNVKMGAVLALTITILQRKYQGMQKSFHFMLSRCY